MLPGDNMTLRPTVVVRRGKSQGSGTIIASIEGETLVLTAAHVLKAEGSIVVELHRYNVGRERMPAKPGGWPRRLPASLAAADAAADVAILRIEKMVALPYVARLAADEGQVAPDSTVTSVGIDLGAKLTSWTTRLVKTVTFELNDSHSERMFSNHDPYSRARKLWRRVCSWPTASSWGSASGTRLWLKDAAWGSSRPERAFATSSTITPISRT